MGYRGDGQAASGRIVRPSARICRMRVSAKSDYALRALIELAGRVDGAPVSAEEIGRCQDIPHGFLQAILADLRRAGMVISQRGQSGGWRMARDPDSVTVADVIRAVDGPLVSVYGLRPESVSYNDSAGSSSTSGSPPVAACARSSSRSPSGPSPTGTCRSRSSSGPRTRTRGSRTDRLPPVFRDG